MSTTIIRADLPERFTTVPQSTVRDSNLSYRARGVLLRLLSNRSGFRMTSEDLAREGKEGRDSIRTALNELADSKYLIVRILRDEKGRFKGYECHIFDVPQTHLESSRLGKQNEKKKEQKDEPTNIGTNIGDFKAAFVKNAGGIGGRFVIGKDLMKKYEKMYPAIEEKHGSIEMYLNQLAMTFDLTKESNQVGKGNWKLSRWLTWSLGEEQNFLSDVACFGLEKALKIKYENR